MKSVITFAGQLAVLAAVYRGAEGLVRALGLPVPGTVLGIIILFTLLCSGLVREKHINEAADFLLRHLVFFFIPIAVGLMGWGRVFYDFGWILLAAMLVSALLPLLTVGFLARRLGGRKRPGS